MQNIKPISIINYDSVKAIKYKYYKEDFSTILERLYKEPNEVLTKLGYYRNVSADNFVQFDLAVKKLLIVSQDDLKLTDIILESFLKLILNTDDIKTVRLSQISCTYARQCTFIISIAESFLNVERDSKTAVLSYFIMKLLNPVLSYNHTIDIYFAIDNFIEHRILEMPNEQLLLKWSQCRNKSSLRNLVTNFAVESFLVEEICQLADFDILIDCLKNAGNLYILQNRLEYIKSKLNNDSEIADLIIEIWNNTDNTSKKISKSNAEISEEDLNNVSIVELLNKNNGQSEESNHLTNNSCISYSSSNNFFFLQKILNELSSLRIYHKLFKYANFNNTQLDLLSQTFFAAFHSINNIVYIDSVLILSSYLDRILTEDFNGICELDLFEYFGFSFESFTNTICLFQKRSIVIKKNYMIKLLRYNNSNISNSLSSKQHLSLRKMAVSSLKLTDSASPSSSDATGDCLFFKKLIYLIQHKIDFPEKFVLSKLLKTNFPASYSNSILTIVNFLESRVLVAKCLKNSEFFVIFYNYLKNLTSINRFFVDCINILVSHQMKYKISICEFKFIEGNVVFNEIAAKLIRKTSKNYHDISCCYSELSRNSISNHNEEVSSDTGKNKTDKLSNLLKYFELPAEIEQYLDLKNPNVRKFESGIYFHPHLGKIEINNIRSSAFTIVLAGKSFKEEDGLENSDSTGSIVFYYSDDKLFKYQLPQKSQEIRIVFYKRVLKITEGENSSKEVVRKHFSKINSFSLSKNMFLKCFLFYETKKSIKLPENFSDYFVDLIYPLKKLLHFYQKNGIVATQYGIYNMNAPLDCTAKDILFYTEKVSKKQ